MIRYRVSSFFYNWVRSKRAVLEGSAKPFGAVMKGAAGPLVLDADLSGSVGPTANLTGADP